MYNVDYHNFGVLTWKMTYNFYVKHDYTLTRYENIHRIWDYNDWLEDTCHCFYSTYVEFNYRSPDDYEGLSFDKQCLIIESDEEYD